jgi:hypothetical protein
MDISYKMVQYGNHTIWASRADCIYHLPFIKYISSCLRDYQSMTTATPQNNREPLSRGEVMIRRGGIRYPMPARSSKDH